MSIAQAFQIYLEEIAKTPIGVVPHDHGEVTIELPSVPFSAHIGLSDQEIDLFNNAVEDAMCKYNDTALELIGSMIGCAITHSNMDKIAATLNTHERTVTETSLKAIVTDAMHATISSATA